MKITCGYTDGPYGQLHHWEAGAAGALPDLVCLHATAYSGRTFSTVMEHLARTRRVIALDTPGYGGSDSPPGEIGVEAYAEAIAQGVRAIRSDARPVDLFGYHTGALIATEMAALHPNLVRRIALVGVPYFDGADREAWRAKLAHETELTESFDQFRARWDFFVTRRAEGLPLARGFDNFVDELRAYPREGWAHKALFNYDAQARLPLVAAQVSVINPTGALAAPSRAAALLMPHATVREVPALAGAPLDLGAALLSSELARFLDNP